MIKNEKTITPDIISNHDGSEARNTAFWTNEELAKIGAWLPDVCVIGAHICEPRRSDRRQSGKIIDCMNTALFELNRGTTAEDYLAVYGLKLSDLQV